MPRRLALAASVPAALLVLLAVALLFRESVGKGGREEAAGVVLAPPPDAVVEAAGELDAPSAARALAALAARRPAAPRVAVMATRRGTRVLLVLDRAAGTIEEKRGAPSGTRVATTWAGGLDERLAAARDRGSFDVPGLAPPEEKNLYH